MRRRSHELEPVPRSGRDVPRRDGLDVLLHERPYKDSWTLEAAADEIRGASGTQFDPAVVKAFDALGPSGWRVGSTVG